MRLLESEALAANAIAAIRAGDVEVLVRLLQETPGLAAATIERRACGNRPPYAYPLVGAATDWPGHFPNVAATIAALVTAGADVNARAEGAHRETALHGAASSDDVDAIDALLDAGADIEAAGAVIAGGTPLDDAVGFGQWRAARRLVQRGARTALWHAAALGLVDRIEQYFATARPPAPHRWGADSPASDVTIAFWCACHGGQRDAAEVLLAHGADPKWRAPWDQLTPIEAARRSAANDVVEWLEAAVPEQ
jgi:uncharacterized protein